MTPKTDETLAKSFADEFEAFVTSDDEYGDQEFGQFCQKHHAEILARLRSQGPQAGETEPVDAARLVVTNNADKWEQAVGNASLLGWFVGQALKLTNGRGAREIMVELSKLRTPAPAAQTRQEIVEERRAIIEFADGLYGGSNSPRDQVISEIVSFIEGRAPASPAPVGTGDGK